MALFVPLSDTYWLNMDHVIEATFREGYWRLTLVNTINTLTLSPDRGTALAAWFQGQRRPPAAAVD